MLKYSEEISGALSRMEVEYWKKNIISNLKIGVEIETNISEEESEEDVIDELQDSFVATNSIESLGDAGIFDVKYDGSLENGAEVVTVGRRLNFATMYNQYRYIIEQMFNYPVYLNGRTGLHNHMLLSYFDDINSMEKNMPGVIFKNFIQLVRRYMRELTFMTSTVSFEEVEEDANNEKYYIITRYNYFCDWIGMASTTPLNKTAKEYIDRLCSNRYRFINMGHLKAKDNEIEKFHLELRFPDGSLFPAQIAAQGIMYCALLLKAVELSEFGVINVTATDEEWNQIKKDMDSLRNDEEDEYRLSSAINETYINKLSDLSKEMILELKPFINMVDRNAYIILQELAKRPVSMRLYDYIEKNNISSPGDDDIRDIYKQINKEFHKIVQSQYNFKSDLYKLISKSIITYEFKALNNKNDWVGAFSNKYDKKEDIVRKELEKINRYRRIKFNKELGTLCFV